MPREVHTSWERTVQTLAAAPGDALLDLGSSASAQELLDAILQSRASGFEAFALSNDDEVFRVFPTARPIPQDGELVLVVEPRRWTGFLLSERGQVLDQVSGSTDHFEAELFPSTYPWGGPACQVTIVPAREVSATRIADVMSVVKVRQSHCLGDSAFSIVAHHAPFQPRRIRRYEPNAGSRTMLLRVRASSPARLNQSRRRAGPSAVAPKPQASSPSGARPSAARIVRESRTLTVDGVRESWRIVWRGKPEPVCTPYDAFGCPCRPFYYGERGVAELVRSRPGHADEILPLAEVFVGGGDWADLATSGQSVLRRWPEHDGDHQTEDRDALARSVTARPSTPLMEFRDYNHDGWAAEFQLPVDTTGCADLRAVVVGVTRHRNRLHAFSSVASPGHPLLLQPGTWNALLSGRDGVPISSVELACGFRGSDRQEEVELKTGTGEIFASRLEYDCPRVGAPRSRAAF